MKKINIVEDIFPVMEEAILGKEHFLNVPLSDDELPEKYKSKLSNSIKNGDFPPMKIQYYGVNYPGDVDEIVKDVYIREQRIYGLDSIEDFDVFEYTIMGLNNGKVFIKTEDKMYRPLNKKSLAELQMNTIQKMENSKHSKNVKTECTFFTLKEIYKKY